MKSLVTDKSDNSIPIEDNAAISHSDYDDYEDYKDGIIDMYERILSSGVNVGAVCSISMRIGKKHFLVTPDLYPDSEKELTADMIVRVRTSDLVYRGYHKPSSEYGIHAECYMKRPDARFVIHTHQMYATCMGVFGYKKLSTADHYGERVNIPCAAYAVPGTKKVAQGLGMLIDEYSGSQGDMNAFILSGHGAVFIGTDDEAVIQNMCRIENVASHFLNIRCGLTIPEKRENGYGSSKEDGVISFTDSAISNRLKSFHMDIYDRQADAAYIIHDKSESVMTVSRRMRSLKPLLDDTARIIGKKIILPYNDHGKDGYYIRVGKRDRVVFLRDEGVLCIGRSPEEAKLIETVIDCEAVAQVVAARFGSYNALSYYDACRTAASYRKNHRIKKWRK